MPPRRGRGGAVSRHGRRGRPFPRRAHLVDGRRVARVSLDGVLVDADARLQGGAAAIEEVVDIGRAVISAALCGVAEEAFARTARYLKERRQFDRRIGSFQALQHRAARMHIEIENAWSATLQAMQSIEARANSAAFDVAVAKAKASETACAATAECLQMHGGIGMTDEFDIGLFLKRARVEFRAVRRRCVSRRPRRDDAGLSRGGRRGCRPANRGIAVSKAVVRPNAGEPLVERTSSKL